MMAAQEQALSTNSMKSKIFNLAIFPHVGCVVL